MTSFFISYAHDDRHYVKRLAAHLRESGLPAWFDADLRWGDRWPRRLSEEIRQAAGVIVVMSPAAAESEWVEREILEGQHYNRPFRPILLDGERLFLLAATQFFDAREGGALPGEREIRELRLLLGSARSESQPDQNSEWSRGGGGDDTAPLSQETTELLKKLRRFLSDGRVEHADILTTAMVLEGAGAERTTYGWLHAKMPEKGKKESVPSGLLAAIDGIWSESTNSRHGFRAQLARYGGPPPGVKPGTPPDFAALAEAVGWRDSRHGAMPRYADFVKPASGAAQGKPAAGDWPPGFFPSLRNPQLELQTGWHDRWVNTVMSVHLRLRTGPIHLRLRRGE